MFDHYSTHKYSTSSYSNSDVTVTENRAPTDKSIEILREMEEKILKDIVSAVKLESNIFNASWHIIQNRLSFGYDLICRFELNGKEYENITKIENGSCRNMEDARAIVQKVQKSITEKLAEIITIDLIEQKGKELFPQRF